MKKKSIKFMTVVLSLIMLFSVVGCKLTNNTGATTKEDKTVIRIMSKGGGYGGSWLQECADRFAKTVEEVSYEEGKTGVFFDIESNLETSESSMSTAGYNIYFTTGSAPIESFVAKGDVIEITDIVTNKVDGRAIEDVILKEYKSEFSVGEKYYALPHFADYPCISYDVQRFKDAGLYLSAPTTDASLKEDYESQFGKATFLKPGCQGTKSCGTDGEYGTEDDGLPTSIVEFLIMCARMKAKGITPFTITGQYIGYLSYFLEALWASLGGPEEVALVKSAQQNEVPYSGQMEVVKYDKDYNIVLTNEKLIDIKGSSLKIMKPATEIVTVNNSTGYKVYDSYARYIAFSLIEIMENYGYFSKHSKDPLCDHINAQTGFICNGLADFEKVGMFIEGAYWFNEANTYLVFDDYKYLAETANEKELGYMTLPTDLTESVVGKENARKNTMWVSNPGKTFINANIKDKEGLVQACKDFLSFAYTDYELANRFIQTGVLSASIDYAKVGIDEDTIETLGSYQKSLYKTVNISNFTNAGVDQVVFYPVVDSVTYGSILSAIRDGKSAFACYDASRIRENKWGYGTPGV